MMSAERIVSGAAGSVAVVVGVALVGAVIAAQDAEPKAAAAKGVGYSGTFSDKSGRKGPIECELTQGEGEKWYLRINAKNEGEGPNRPFECSFSLPGKKDGATVNLSGTADVARVGAHEVNISVTDKTLEGKFKKTDGKNSGSFSMTPAKSAP